MFVRLDEKVARKGSSDTPGGNDCLEDVVAHTSAPYVRCPVALAYVGRHNSLLGAQP